MWRALLIGLAGAGSAQADLAVVTSQGAGRLTLVETTTGEVLREVALPGQPAALAVGGGWIATVAVGTKTLHLLDLQGREQARHVFPGAPFGVAFDAAGEILVTDAAGEGALHRLRVPDLTLRGTAPAAANPTGIDADAAGWIVVAARDADLALLYPPGCDACTPTKVPVGHHPFGVTLHQGRAFVTNVLSDDVSVIDLAAGREIARITTESRPYALAFAAGRGFVTNQYASSLTVFDAQTLRVIGRIETGDYPEGIAATSEGDIVVATWFSDQLQIFDATTFELKVERDMPEGPRAFGRFVTLSPAP